MGNMEINISAEENQLEVPEGGALYNGEVTEDDIPEAVGPTPTPLKGLPALVKKRISWARKCAKAGLGVLVIHPGTKRPRDDGWQTHPHTDPDTILHILSTPDPSGHYPNYGLCPLGSFVFVDTDNGMKKGRQRQGENNLKAVGDLPDTFMTKTPSGGFHRIYRVPHPVTNDAKSLPQDVDIRGHAGQVVGIGSELIEGLCDKEATPGVYEHVSGSLENIPDAPQWMLDKLEKHEEHGDKSADLTRIMQGDTDVPGSPSPYDGVRAALSWIDFTMDEDQDTWTGITKALFFNQLPIYDKGERISNEVAEELCHDAMSGRLWGGGPA